MNTELSATAQRGGALSVREDFAGQEIQQVAETASTAVAAQARAAVESRYVMAYKRPRDWDGVRVALLKECSRPGFAASARYHKPIGKGVEGPSIRFAEAALRCMGNVLAEVTVIYDDDRKRIVRVSVTELEGNLSFPTEIVVEKTVERKQLKQGQQALGSRTNSYGDRVYLVAATEDDLLNKQAALVSKALRQNGLRLLPGDIQEECMDRVIEVLKNADAADPDAAKKKMADAFAALGVQPAQLREYLGHELGQCSPAELGDLRALWVAIRDGETTWSAAMENETAVAKDAAANPAAISTAPAATGPAAEPAKGTAGLKERLRKKQPELDVASSPAPVAEQPAREPGQEG